MSPCRVPPGGGTRIGENGVERTGTESGGSDGESEGGQFAAGGSSGVAGAELSAGEAGVGAVSRGWSQGFAAWELRAAVEPGAHCEVPAGGTGSSAGALCRFRTDAGERTSGQRRRVEDSCGEFAALDGGSGPVAEEAQTQAVPSAAGTQAALWRTG